MYFATFYSLANGTARLVNVGTVIEHAGCHALAELGEIAI
jgi:hypothetical protein